MFIQYLSMRKMDKNKKLKKELKNNNACSRVSRLKDDMTDLEVEEQFIKMLDQCAITEAKRLPLANKTIDQKRLAVTQLQRIFFDAPKYIQDLYEIIQDKLPPEMVPEKLYSVMVAIRSSNLTLLKEFNNSEHNGLKLLNDVLTKYIDNLNIAYACLKCIRAFGNCGYGLLTLIKSKETQLLVVYCLSPQHRPLMSLALELLTIFTFYSFESHSNVMEVLYMASRSNSSGERFMPIVNGLHTAMDEDIISLIIPCLQFINVIVNPNFKDVSTCSNLDFNYSSHLRIEFVRCGLNTILDQILLKYPDENIRHHVLLFQSDNEYEEDYISKVDHVRMFLKDRDTIYQTLSRSICNTNCDQYLTSILQHLVIIKDNPVQYPIYRLIDDIVAEVILHSDGMCPDPNFNQLDSYDLSEIFEKFNDQKSICSNELQEKLDKAVAEKHEAEAKLNLMENRLVTNVMAPVSGIVAPPPPPPPPGIAAPPPPPSAPPTFAVPSPVPPPGNAVPPPCAPPPVNGFDQKLPFGMYIKTPLKPKCPMKKANWSKVDTNLLEKNCIWKAINEDDLNITDTLLELGEMFSTRCVKAKDKIEDNASLSSYSSLPRKVKEYKVLDPKSGQNLAILSGSLKVSHQEIKRRILELDESLLSQTTVENILKNLPSADQLSMLAELNEDYENLNEAEQFGCILASINRLHSRLNSLLFKMKFNERVSDIKPSIICATEALLEVRNSSSLPKILELVLHVGNFMNNASKSTLTVGFHLSFLTTLSEMKDNSGEVTMMEFLVTQIKNKFPALLSVTGELTYLDKTSRVSNEYISSTISEMGTIKKSLERELKGYKKQAENDNYLEVMENFLDSVNQQFSLISEMNTKLQQTYVDIAKYFSFDFTKYKMEEFFLNLKQFKNDFRRSLDDLEKSELLNLKRKKAQEEKMRQGSKNLEKQKQIPTHEEDKEVLDDLLKTLHSGYAYCKNNLLEDKQMNNKLRRKKRERLHVINRSRSRRDFDISMIPSLSGYS